MVKIKMEVKEDGIYKTIPIDSKTCLHEMIIDKETFVKAFQMYIENSTETNTKDK